MRHVRFKSKGVSNLNKVPTMNPLINKKNPNLSNLDKAGKLQRSNHQKLLGPKHRESDHSKPPPERLQY